MDAARRDGGRGRARRRSLAALPAPCSRRGASSAASARPRRPRPRRPRSPRRLPTWCSAPASAAGSPRSRPATIAVASAIVFADLGAETADGFLPVSELGLRHRALRRRRRARRRSWPTAPAGTSAPSSPSPPSPAPPPARPSLAARYPDAVAEAHGGRRRRRRGALLRRRRSPSSARSATPSARATARPGRSRRRCSALGSAHVAEALA